MKYLPVGQSIPLLSCWAKTQAMAWWQGLKVLVALIRPPSLLCLNLDGSSPRAYLFSSGWWAQFVGKYMGLPITIDIFLIGPRLYY